LRTAFPFTHPLPLHTTLWYYHNVEFIESQPFTRKLHRLAGDGADGVLRALQTELERKPDRGAMVPGLRGVRKARLANPGRGKGKRGGYRYLYLYLETRHHIHRLLLLDKNEQEDATEEQRKQIRQWAAQVKRDSGG
jgi:mRNA-degrading endonuclease RelE of RelBE toxin-antitoxin system